MEGIQISITVPEFERDKFFASPNIVLGEKFRTLVFSKIPANVPANQDLRVTYRGIGDANDTSSILKMGGVALFAPDEWAQILYFGIVISNGDGGLFRRDGSYNLSYLNASRQILAAYALFNFSEGAAGVWHIGANPIDTKNRGSANRRLIYRAS